MAPVFTPRATIQNRTDLGNALLRQAMKGQQNVSSLSPFANLAQGLAGGFLRGSANRFARGNQTLRNQTLDEIGNAPDGASMGRILMNSADPKQREFGMMQMIKEQQAAARKAEADRAYDQNERRLEQQKRPNDARTNALERSASLQAGGADNMSLNAIQGMDNALLTENQRVALHHAAKAGDIDAITTIRNQVREQRQRGQQESIAKGSSPVGAVFQRSEDVLEGQTVEDTMSGQRYVKRNGTLVPRFTRSRDRRSAEDQSTVFSTGSDRTY